MANRGIGAVEAGLNTLFSLPTVDGRLSSSNVLYSRHVLRVVIAHGQGLKRVGHPIFGGRLHVLGPGLSSTAWHVKRSCAMKKRCKISGVSVGRIELFRRTCLGAVVVDEIGESM